MAEQPARATANSRVNFSVFLLAAIVSVVSETTDSLQEVHVDTVQNEDGISSSRHDPANDAPWPHQQPARRRRKPTGADRQKVIDTLNRLRRSLGAPDMYYAAWSREMERSAVPLTSGCGLHRRAEVPVPATYALGLTGYTPAHGVAGEIQKIYFQGPNSTFYRQIMSSHLRPMSKWQPTSSALSSPTCSQCDIDALWCDAGLCRIKCRSGDTECVLSDRHDCEKTCSACDTAVGDSHCQCVCYYDNDRRRCTDEAVYATKNQPICRPATKDALQTPAGFLSLTVCVLLVFIVVCIFMACCITRCRSRKRNQRRFSGAAGSNRAREVDDGSAAVDSAAPSAFVVGSPIVLSPPAYADVAGGDSRPPPYYGCASYHQLSLAGGDTQPGLCSVADLPSTMSVQPTAPPTLNNDLTSSGVELGDVGRTPAYGNPAFSDSGV